MSDPTPEDDRTLVQPPTGGGAAAAPTPAPAPGGRSDIGNALPVGMYLDEFELRSVAGEGGFSIVYRAWDHSLKRQVAVKEYFPSGMVARVGGTQVTVRSERHTEAFEAGLRSFVEEARLLAQFDHPSLVKVYRFWKANGSAYMVMPFCEGITLRDDWRSRPEPPDEQALMTLLDPLTEALDVLHAERWYHRDIAPDNVMLLAGTRRPLLLDFGAARQVIGDLTHALTVILKPGYAPIEQWGEVPGMQQGPWTDVYALAAMVHFGILKRTPPPSVGRLVNDSYEPLSQVVAGKYSERFLHAIDHALAVRPELRTQTIEQFREEIGLNEFVRERTQTWLHGGTVTGHMPAPAVNPATVIQAPLPTMAATSPSAAAPGAPQFTQQIDSGPTVVLQPAPAPARRNPALLFLGGLLATGVLGLVAYKVFKPEAAPTPAPVPVTQAAPPKVEPAPPAPAPEAASQAVANNLPAPPPVTTPVAAAGPEKFDAQRDFGRILAAQAPDHRVEVTLVRTVLRSGKDDIAFTVKSSQDGYLYVVQRGSDGALLQIYPNKFSGLPRVRKGVPLDLPKSEIALRIDGPSGQNQLLVMVSELQRDHAPFVLRVQDGFTYYRTGPAADELSATHKGPLPWVAGTPKCPAKGACADVFGATVATFETVQ